MLRVIGGLGVLLVALMVPIVLLAGAMGMMATSSNSGSTSPYIEQLVALGYDNGRLPREALTVVSSRSNGYECQVASVGSADRAWMALVAAAEDDGVDIEGGWCYRTYQSQVSAWNRRQCYIPGNCDGDPHPPTARPGTSVHGWGLAIDVWGASDNILGCSAPELLWLQINAPRFGWVNPEWARCGHLGSEPWHWEYVGSELIAPTGDSRLKPAGRKEETI